ncbi:MAG: NEW3 domain-containing protein [Candidatus Bathyarchaeota archaeon]|nr:NEW3 domain-containing protein [Candidatus Bathyarchaeota archaeon]
MEKKLLIFTLAVLVFTQSSFQIFPVLTEGSYTIRGVVVDDEGSRLEGVDIFVYFKSEVLVSDILSGKYLFKVSTNDKGAFKINVDRADYELVFKKRGYVTQSHTVSLGYARTFEYSFGKIKFETCLKMESISSCRTVNPGERLVVPFQLFNEGEDDEDCLFHTIFPEGWEAVITDQIGEVESLNLSPSDSAQLNLEVFVSSTASGLNKVQLIIIGETTINQTLLLSVEEEVEAFLSCTYPSISGQQGDTIDFRVELSNPFYFEARFGFEIVLAPECWNTHVLNSELEKINEILIEGNSGCEILVEVEIPLNATLESYNIILKTSSANHSDELYLKVLVESEEIPDAAEIKAKYPSQSVQLGKKVVYPIMIENSLESEELFQLSAYDAPTGWDIVFKTGEGQEIQAVLISAGTTEEINVAVTPSLNSNPDTYSLTIVAESIHIQGSVTLNAIIVGSHEVSMDVSSIYTQIKAGSTQTINVKVTNTGYSPINNVKIEIPSYPEGWNIETLPLKISTLNPNEAETFQVSIQPPEGTAPGDYLIKVRTHSDQISTEEVIRVTVSVGTTWGIYGIAMIAAALGIVVIVYKKFRRR